MKCKIISISHKLSDWEKQALQFYSKQIPSNFKISFAEVKPLSPKNLDIESILEAERVEIVKQINADSHVILWDRAGKKINSLEFATLLQDKIDNGVILGQIKLPMPNHPTMFKVIKITKDAGGELMCQVVKNIFHKKIDHKKITNNPQSYFSWPTIENIRHFKNQGGKLI